jgi:hypothetical protein
MFQPLDPVGGHHAQIEHDAVLLISAYAVNERTVVAEMMTDARENALSPKDLNDLLNPHNSQICAPLRREDTARRR